MNSLEIIELVEGLKLKNMPLNEIISVLAEKKIVHRLASISIAAVYKISLESAREKVYADAYYADFKDEENPFNKELFN